MDLNNSLNSSMRKIAPAHSAGAICPSHLSRASLAQSQATFPRSELCLIGKIAWNQTYRKLNNYKLDIGVYPDTMYPIPRYLGPISEYTPIPCSLGINLGFLGFEGSVFKCLVDFLNFQNIPNLLKTGPALKSLHYGHVPWFLDFISLTTFKNPNKSNT